MKKTLNKITQNSEEHTIYKELAELLPQTVFEINTKAVLTFGNLNGLKMFGYTMDDFNRGLNVIDLIEPSERLKAKESLQLIFQGKKPTGAEFTALRKDGSTFPIVIYSSVIVNKGIITGARGIIIDISERKKIENELKESELKFRSLAEKSLVGIYIIQDGFFTYVNSTFAEIFGYTSQEIINRKTPSDLTSEESRMVVSENISKRLKSEVDSLSYEFIGLRKNKKPIYVQVYGTRTMINGKPTIVGSLIDISQRKKSEEQLQDLSKRNEVILQTAADGFHIANAKGEIVKVNTAFCNLTGYSEQELLNLNINCLYEVGSSITLKTIKKLIVEKKPYFESRIKRKDSTVIDVEVSANLLQPGQDLLIFLSVRNITEKKLNEQKIRQLSSAVEQSPVSVLISDINGIIEYVNPRFSEVSGYSFAEVAGKTTEILKSGEQDESFYRNLWETIRSGKEWKGEFHNKKKNGELFWEQASISPIKDATGRITNFLAVKEDITERKKIETELRQAKDKAEEINRLKSNFLANMSHELRTPLIGVLGFADILLNELKNPEHVEMAKTILHSGQRLLENLNMILDLSRLEADRYEFDFRPVDISVTVKEIASCYTDQASDKNLNYIVDAPESNLISVLDAKILAQVINNLLNNAFKFTKRGSITVEVKYSSDSNYNVIRVIDTGIGISKDEQKVIFQEFRQANEGLNRPYEGTGLGLTISKRFVELMGGRIELESTPGAGSTFTVRFPALRKNITDVYSPVIAESPEKHTGVPLILSVENDLSSVKIIRYFLKNVCRVEHAESGEEAVQLAKKNKYDAVLMDINLGTGITGLETVKSLKSIPAYKHTPVVAVTAYALPGDREKFLKNGCSHYISKPFERKSLVQLMTEILKA